LDRIIDGEKIAIITTMVSLSYKIIFVACMLHIFYAFVIDCEELNVEQEPES